MPFCKLFICQYLADLLPHKKTTIMQGADIYVGQPVCLDEKKHFDCGLVLSARK